VSAVTPETEDPNSTAPDWEIWRPRLTVPDWLRNNPGLVFSVLYLALSVVGLLYQGMFFRRFRLNVLEFSDATDFLMVVVREPLVVAMASLGLVFYYLYMRGSLAIMGWCYRRFPRLTRDPVKLAEARIKARSVARPMQWAFILTYAGVFTMMYSLWQAKRARAGDFPQVKVEYKSGALTEAPREATLLGSTSRFVLLYDAEARRAQAVPADSIARLSWDARSKEERAKETAPAPAAP
jgi:hypothetical protein